MGIGIQGKRLLNYPAFHLSQMRHLNLLTLPILAQYEPYRASLITTKTGSTVTNVTVVI